MTVSLWYVRPGDLTQLCDHVTSLGMLNKDFFATTKHIILESWKLIKERLASYFEALFTTSLAALTSGFSSLAEIILCLAFSTAMANACLDL